MVEMIQDRLSALEEIMPEELGIEVGDIQVEFCWRTELWPTMAIRR
jgi:hypothetical protein